MLDDQLAEGLPDTMASALLRNLVKLVVGDVESVLDRGIVRSETFLRSQVRCWVY